MTERPYHHIVGSKEPTQANKKANKNQIPVACPPHFGGVMTDGFGSQMSGIAEIYGKDGVIHW